VGRRGSDGIGVRGNAAPHEGVVAPTALAPSAALITFA
jgi:hypothetical protein